MLAYFTPPSVTMKINIWQIIYRYLRNASGGDIIKLFIVNNATDKLSIVPCKSFEPRLLFVVKDKNPPI